MSRKFLISAKIFYRINLSSSEEVLSSIDVLCGAVVIALHGNDLRRVAQEDGPAPFVAVESDELVEEGSGEPDGVAPASVEDGDDDRRAGTELPGNGRHRLRADERHIGEGDDPSIGIRLGGDSECEARSHSSRGAFESEDLEALAFEETRERRVSRSDDGDGAIDRREERSRREARYRPSGERREELLAAEAAPDARREEDADDHRFAFRPAPRGVRPSRARARSRGRSRGE